MHWWISFKVKQKNDNIFNYHQVYSDVSFHELFSERPARAENRPALLSQ